MRCAFVYLVASLFADTFFGQVSANNRAPVIAESGGVEIASMKIVRQKVSAAAVNADLSNMEVKLWLTGEVAAGSDRYLVRVTELSSIQDDAGNELLTPRRRELMSFVNGDTPGRETQTRDGKSGPVITLKLEAPARAATTIKSIQGKAVVSKSGFVKMEFKDLAALRDQELQHKSLADFPIRATVEESDGSTHLRLETPSQHDRLVAWGLIKNGRMVGPRSEGEGLEDDRSILEADYDGEIAKDCTLGLMLAEPTASQMFEFDFRDVELP